jgi:predicted transcriptional regulator
MTIKELAEFTGKNETTIQRWVKKAECKMQSVHEKMINAGHGKSTNFDIDETECILQSGSMSKDAVSILMNNAREEELRSSNNAIAKVESNVFNMQMFADIMAVSLATALKPLYDRIEKIESKTPEQLLIESIPEKPPRAIFTQKMNRFMELTRKTPHEAYHFVYDEIGATYGIRIMSRAKNRKCTVVDVLEADGYLGKGIAVIMNLIKVLEQGV